MDYELVTYNGYDLVNIDKRFYLIDTGAPSISFDGHKVVNINGAPFNLIQNTMPEETMISSFGRTISGFIGYDLIKYFGSIEVDRINKVVRFGAASKNCENKIPLNNLVFDIKVNDVPCQAYLDTGAPNTAVRDKAVLNKGVLIDPNHNEQTNNGPHVIPLYKGTIEFNGAVSETIMFYLDETFPQGPCGTYFALNNLAKEFYVIDFRNGFVSFK